VRNKQKLFYLSILPLQLSAVYDIIKIDKKTKITKIKIKCSKICKRVVFFAKTKEIISLNIQSSRLLF